MKESSNPKAISAMSKVHPHHYYPGQCNDDQWAKVEIDVCGLSKRRRGQVPSLQFLQLVLYPDTPTFYITPAASNWKEFLQTVIF